MINIPKGMIQFFGSKDINKAKRLHDRLQKKYPLAEFNLAVVDHRGFFPGENIAIAMTVMKGDEKFRSGVVFYQRDYGFTANQKEIESMLHVPINAYKELIEGLLRKNL
jgi:hypothetical protein